MKRILSLVLVLLMCLSLGDVFALAKESAPEPEEIAEELPAEAGAEAPATDGKSAEKKTSGKKSSDKKSPDKEAAAEELAQPVLASVKCTAAGVQFKWKKVSGAKGYRVYRRTADGDWKKLAVIDDKTVNTYIDDTVVSGKTYSYSVAALANKTASAYDAAGLTITYVAAPTVSALTNRSAGIYITWDAVKGASAYRVYRRVGGGDWEKVCVTADTSAVDGTAEAGVTYTYSVRCLSEDGTLASAILDGKSILRLSAPELQGAVTEENGVNVKWKKVPGATGYRVLRRTTDGEWAEIAQIDDAATRAYLDESAGADSAFIYTVRAVSGNTVSGYDSDGVRQSGFFKDGEKTYYIRNNGDKATGWVKVDGNKYYFGAKGGMITGWKTIEGSKYYFYEADDANGGPEGAMAKNVTIGDYRLTSTGEAMPKAKFKMIRKAQQYSSPTQYLVMTDTYACRVGVFTGSQGNWELLYYWKCSPGKDSTPTALGTFQVGMKVWFFGDGFRCWYATQYNGNYLFHSVLYNYDGTIQDGTLGERVSHGCIRLAISHAKWMYDNLPEHTTCINY